MNKNHHLMVNDCPISELEHTAISAASHAADILREGFYSDIEVKEKTSRHDLVTQYDLKSEKAIRAVIKENHPTHAIIGEEFGVEGDTEKEIVWIIDPIDGTWNFAKQIPAFSISIAATFKGITYLGVCLDPISHELFIARKGLGATMNGKNLSVSSIDKLSHSGISLGTVVGIDTIHKIAQIRRSGSSVLDLCYVAKGALEGFIAIDQCIWDFVAAALIVEEAGGVVTSFENHPLHLDWKKKMRVVASNRKIHEELIKWISMEKK